MKKILSVLLALGLLLGVSWAMAEVSAESNATVTGTEAISLTVLNGTVSGETVTGSFYYIVKVTIPEGAGDTIQFGWGSDPEAEAPDGWETYQLSELEPGDNDREKVFVSYPGETEGSTYTDVVFARLNDGDNNVSRLTLVYDLNAEDSSLATHVSGGGMELLKPVTVTWDEVAGADGYILFWSDPLDRLRWAYTRATAITFDDDFYTGIANTVGYVGTYQFWVLPLKDGKKGVVPDDWHKYIDTITEPEPDGRITLTAGASTARLQENVQFLIEAPGAVEMRFFAGYELWDWIGWDENGRSEQGWSASDAGQVGRVYQFYAQARFEGEEDWATSAVKTVRVLGYDEADTMQGELTWSMMSEGELPRDGLIEILVDRLEGAEYYAACLTKDDEWVADSGWFDANPDGATPVTLPMLDCEAGESYELHVYAVKIGVPQVESEHTESVKATAPASAGKILVAMKDTFQVHEPLRISLDYTEKETLDRGWIDLRIVRADDRNDVWYKNSGYPRFQDYGCSLDRGGDYLLLAAVYTNPEEPEQAAAIEFPFTVTSDGSLEGVRISGVPALHRTGEAMSVSVQEVEGAEWYDLMLHYIPEEGDWEELDAGYLEAAEAENHLLGYTFAADLFNRPGRYRAWARASAKGKDSTSEERFFTVQDSVDESLTLTVNGASGLDSYPANQEIELTVNVQGAVAVRMLDEWGNWQTWDSREFDEDGSFTWYCAWGPGTYTTVAQASYDADERYQDWDNFDWDDFDMNRDLTWTRSSNQVTMSFVSEGPAPKAVFTADETVTRGKLLKVQITDATENGVTAERFYVRILDENGDEWKHEDFGEVTAFPVTATLPTGDLPEGSYTIAVGSCLPGYEWTETQQSFSVTESEAFILDIQEDPVSDLPFSISAYVPEASRTELWVLDKENSITYEMYADGRGEGLEAMDQRWHGGVYDLYVLARYEDEDGNETREPWQSEVVSVSVRYLGKLDEPVITLESMLIQRAEGLTFTVNGLDQVDWYDIQIWDEDAMDPETGESLAIARWTSEDGPAPAAFTVAPENLTAEHVYGIDAYVYRTGYRDNSSRASFTVVENAQVSLRLESENGTDDISWLSHKEITFRLYAPGAQAVRFLRAGGEWDYRDGCNQEDGWFTWSEWLDRGVYTAVAQAAYDGYDFLHNDWDTFDWDTFDWSAAGFTWTATSNSIRVTAVSAGQLDAPKFTLEKDEVVRGELLTVHITELQGKDEWYDARLREDDTDWESENAQWDEQTKTITLPTAEATPGTYRLTVWASAEGMEGSEAFLPVTVLEAEDGAIVFEVSSDTVLLHEPVTVSVYARDAEHIGFALDGERWDLDEEGNYQWGDCRDHWQNDEDICWHEAENGETHTLQAFALYDGVWVTSEEKTITVRVLGQVELEESGLPATLPAGVAAELRFPLPEHAEGMNIGLYEDWDDDEGWHRNVIHNNREYTEDTVLTVPAENLIAGHRIVADWDAWGHEGYRGSGTTVDIPILAPASDLVTISASGDNFDAQAGTALAEGEFQIRVIPAEGHSLTAVRFYDGNGYWDRGEALTRENRSDLFLTDGSFEATVSYHDDRTYTAFADVQLDGGEDWVSTHVLTFTLRAVGEIGAYDFADPSDITVARGEAVTLRFTEAENASEYWVDVFDEEQSYDPQTTFEGTEVTLLTGSLPEGTYKIRGRAGGEPGYFWRESNSAKRLTVTAAQIPDSGIQVTFSKTEVETLERFTVSVYAPGAERLRLCHWEEENVWWDEEGESHTATHWLVGGEGEQVFYIYAMFGGEWSQPVTATINLAANGEAPAATVTATPNIARPGEPITVHVEMPEGVEYYDIWANIMRPEGEEWPVVIPYSQGTKTGDYIIQTADLSEDDTIIIGVETYARGKQSTTTEAHAIVSSLKDLWMNQITLTTPASLTEIGEEAFVGINARAVWISDRVTTIGERAFAESAVRQIVIPRSVTEIADNAFEDNGAVVIFAPAGSYAEQWVLDHQNQQPVYFIETADR